jgi:hypothetical protein
MTIDFGCDGCGKLDPLLETADGRALCIRCVERDTNHGIGIEADAIQMLKTLTQLTTVRGPEVN